MQCTSNNEPEDVAHVKYARKKTSPKTSLPGGPPPTITDVHEVLRGPFP